MIYWTKTRILAISIYYISALRRWNLIYAHCTLVIRYMYKSLGKRKKSNPFFWFAFKGGETQNKVHVREAAKKSRWPMWPTNFNCSLRLLYIYRINLISLPKPIIRKVVSNLGCRVVFIKYLFMSSRASSLNIILTSFHGNTFVALSPTLTLKNDAISFGRL